MIARNTRRQDLRKILIIGAAVTALAVPTAAMAAAPDSTFVPKDNATVKTNLVADGSSKITQNGQWVGGHNVYTDAGLNVSNPDAYWWADQTSDAGSRSDHVQSLLGHTDTGKPQS